MVFYSLMSFSRGLFVLNFLVVKIEYRSVPLETSNYGQKNMKRLVTWQIGMRQSRTR